MLSYVELERPRRRTSGHPEGGAGPAAAGRRSDRRDRLGGLGSPPRGESPNPLLGIAAAIAANLDIDRFGLGTVFITSDALVWEIYQPEEERRYYTVNGWKPTLAQRKAVTRAMHSFVRKHQQYSLTGGQGRRELYLYDAADPLSATWAKLNAERRQRNPICLQDAKAFLERAAV